MSEVAESDVEIKSEMRARMVRYSNVLVWSLLFIYPLFSIADFLVMEEYWKQLFQVRLLLIVIIYGCYQLSIHMKWHPNLPLHIAITLVTAQMAGLLSFADSEDLRIYFLFYTALFITFNSIALWKQWVAFVHFLSAVLMLSGTYYFFSTDSFTTILNNGGYMFLVSSFFSCIIPGIRSRNLGDNIRQQIQLKNSFDRLSVQNGEMQEQKEKIEKFTQQKNSVLRIARHDLKNTTGAIYSLTSLALEDFDKGMSREEIRETLRMSNDAARKMIYLIDQLLVPFDYKDSSIHFNYETVEFIREIRSVIQALKPLADSKNIVIDEQHSGESVFVKSDKIYFSIIIRNLVNYAIRLSQNNNTIHIISGRQHNRAFFEVIDKTRGINKEEMEELFNRMQELKEATDVLDASQGIGLSVARLLAHNMGGKLEYASSRELGIQFRVEFNAF